MKLSRYYERPTKDIEPSQYIVAFLDVLGFKNLLATKSFNVINILFEEIADAIYHQQRFNYLQGFDKIQSRIVNFSDSIIIFSKLFDYTRENFQINNLVFNIFHLMIRDVMATAMRLRIPLRGAISIGEMYAGEASSIVPDEVFRTSQIVSQDLLDRFQEAYDTEEVFKKKIIPSFTFPIHFGDALTEAYLLESSINSIGIFMEPNKWKGSHITPQMEICITRKDIIPFKVDDRALLCFNWCNRIDYDTYIEVEKFIKEEVNKHEGRIAAKWRSLADFIKIAPKK